MNLPLIPIFPLKRLTDICISGVLIIVCLPVFFIIFVVMSLNMLICPEDRGQFIYREKRISRGKPFFIFKLRMVKQKFADQAYQTNTCIRDFEDDLQQLTWTGRYVLKNRYLDELPQVFNIFKGDMSLVGPRPLAVPLVKAQMDRGITFRYQIIAGWTSIGQIQYKGIVIDQQCNREDLDQQYVDYCFNHHQWQIWCFDMWVLFRTIRVVIEGKGI
ncbi:MAG: sugar transferase [Candidatus Magnetomorum sp.]|nr:sugar transferase [Candidatus Magnetomorum sp.]